jgi:hypothetical protein
MRKLPRRPLPTFAYSSTPTTKAVAAAWAQHGAGVKLYEFPTSAGLKHDMIDPGQPYQKVDLLYPVLLDAITDDAFTSAAAPGTQ